MVNPFRTLVAVLCLSGMTLLSGHAGRADDAKASRKDEPARTDRYGDPLPDEAVARLGTVRLRDGHGIDCAAFSPDGKWIVSGGKAICLWDAKTHQKVRQFGEQKGYIQAVAFSPDSKILASGRSGVRDYGELRLWEVATGKSIRRLGEPGLNCYQTAFAPDGKTIATLHPDGFLNHKVCLWEVSTGKILRQWEGPKKNSLTEFSASIVFAPDGKALAFASGQDDVIRIWDPNDGTELRTLSAKDLGTFGALAFSSDGSILAGASGRGIQLFQMPTGRELRLFEVDKETVASVVFFDNGKSLASSGNDDKLRIWDVSTGKERKSLHCTRNEIRALAVSPDGTTLACTRQWGGEVVRLWDLKSGEQCGLSMGHQTDVRFVKFLDKGQTVLSFGDYDSTLTFWPGATEKDPHHVKLPQKTDKFALCTDRRSIALITEEGTFLMLEVARGKVLRRFATGADGAWVESICSNGKRVAAYYIDDSIRVWDIATGKQLSLFTDFEPKRGGGLFSLADRVLAISPDGRTLAAESDNSVLNIWDLENGHNRCCCDGHATGSRNAIFSPCVAFSPDGRTIACTDAFGSVIRLWEAATGKERGFFEGANEKIYSLVFSPDGKTLASAGRDETIRLWGIIEGKELHEFRGHQGGVYSVDLSPDGKKLVSGSRDTTALIWDIPAAVRDRKLQVTRRLDREDELWEELASSDGIVAFRAMWALTVSGKQAVNLCKMRLAQIGKVSSRQIASWIKDLDHEEFEVRARATLELERVVEFAEPALRRALEGHTSLEMHKRIDGLLEPIQDSPPGPRLVQDLRAIEVLEHIGSAEADEVLKEVAKLGAESRLALAAKAALDRMK